MSDRHFDLARSLVDDDQIEAAIARIRRDDPNYDDESNMITWFAVALKGVMEQKKRLNQSLHLN